VPGPLLSAHVLHQMEICVLPLSARIALADLLDVQAGRASRSWQARVNTIDYLWVTTLDVFSSNELSLSVFSARYLLIRSLEQAKSALNHRLLTNLG
jgi:hypothetical protein